MHGQGKLLTVTIKALLLCLILFNIGYCQGSDLRGPSKFGVGIQSAPFPIFGASGIINVNKNLAFEVIGNPLWDVDFVAARLILRFRNETNYIVYGYCLVGTFTDDNVTEHLFGPEQTDTAPGFGLGGGFEYFFKGLPKIGWNLEAGFIHIDFEPKWWEYDYESWSLFMVGAGIHYWW